MHLDLMSTFNVSITVRCQNIKYLHRLHAVNKNYKSVKIAKYITQKMKYSAAEHTH